MESAPHISIVIPIRNEERFIGRTIQYLLDQDYPPDKYEILIVDGDSDDRSCDIVSDLAARDRRVRLLHNSKCLSSAARNTGAQNARGDIVTYIDGHTYIDNNRLLKNIAACLSEQNVSVLSRPQFLDTPDNTPFQQAVSLARKSPVGHGLDSTIYTDRDQIVNPTSSGATYRKEVFAAVGGFDETFDACEDVEFNYRVAKAGYSSFTSLRLAVYYYPRESLRGLFRQMKRYGTGRFRLARKHPATLGFGTLIPFLFTVGVPLTALLSLAHRWFFYLFLAAAVPYTLMVLAASIVIAARHGWGHLSRLPLIFVTIHTGLGWGFLVEMFLTLIGKGAKVA